MKRVGLICMALNVCAMLFGCGGAEKGPWQSLTYHVTSSVMQEGCHFSLARSGEEMSLTGFCFDGDTECSVEEAKPVSRETAAAIAAMELDEAGTAKGKPFGMADGTVTTVTLGYCDGSDRKISLSPEQRQQLKQLLQRELTGK